MITKADAEKFLGRPVVLVLTTEEGDEPDDPIAVIGTLERIFEKDGVNWAGLKPEDYEEDDSGFINWEFSEIDRIEDPDISEFAPIIDLGGIPALASEVNYE